jgi:hypothetical protein
MIPLRLEVCRPLRILDCGAGPGRLSADSASAWRQVFYLVL